MMDAIYRLGRATAAEVRASIPAPPSDAAVRATLQILVSKGLLAYNREGRRYVYAPTISHQRARRAALRHLLQTYFDGSIHAALAALLRTDRTKLSEEDYQRLIELIQEAELRGKT
jgi:predicted transcriptional regulator